VTRPLATYSFLPWLRQGLAGQIGDQDHDANVHERASVHVQLTLTGDPLPGVTPAPTADVDRDVQLYGPGDVVGIDRRAIVRTEPRDWITNYEPNYMPAIEFYDEDFAWRYTPAAPDGSRLHLRPWIMLVVLEEGVEFEEGRNVAGKPLPYIDVADPATLPPADQLWAWAHVHVNRSLAGSDAEFTSTDMGAVLPRLQATLNENPDLAYCRIVCPRRLKPNTPYHAFLVPVFETGRLAGLGLDPNAGVPHATFSAWGTYTGQPAAGSLPVYHRWYFRTGTEGDFEYLVRLLKPVPVDKRVGTRDVDVREPGAGLPGIDDADLGGILKLGGALRVPRSSFDPDELEVVERYENWFRPYPHDFQRALAAFVNLPDDYAVKEARDANADADLPPALQADVDPLITAPLYGRWHALVQRLLRDRAGQPVSPDDNWVHELNLDPRHRLAAGFGTRVVQTNQEEYMNAAWEQIGDVLEANRRIREAQLAKLTAASWYARVVRPLAAQRPERALVLTAPVQRHVLTDGLTVRHRRDLSLVPPVLTSVAMRRITRPRARIMRALPAARPDTLLDRVNDGRATAAPPKATPPGVVTTDEVADVLLPPGLPPALVDALRRFPWLPLVPLLLAVLVVLLVLLLGAGAALIVAGAVVVAALVALWWLLRRWARAIAESDVLREPGLTEEAVDRLPTSPDFVITAPGAGVVPNRGPVDSPQASRFKDALRDWHALHAASVASAAEPPPVRLDLPALAGGTVSAIDPDVTIPRRTLHGIDIPSRIADALGEEFQEVMAYPEIDVPMYEPLKKISDELFLPNLNLIQQNSITLLETNQAFIEAYMVGLNHEFARELLWREYPTDQRGSCFRQFWDVRGVLDTEGLDPDALHEKLRDIPELHRWSRTSELGDHDNRELPGDDEEEVVLVIRGELLKKYPNAVIYAQKARWQMSGGHIDPSQERLLVEITEAEEEQPPRDKLRTPLYEARVDPDITFFGFDLTVTEARGGSGESDSDPPGWFFVIKERPGEPRFGFDISRDGPIQTVNDIAWEDAAPGSDPGDFVSGTSLGAIALAPLGPGDEEKTDQRADDLKVVTAPTSAARWGYILFQAPVIVAVHASEMLPRP
jgi:hypothetical protein